MKKNGISTLSYSVLMSVYHKEKAEYLRIAMNSMWNQTVPPYDFVLVCDGPLTKELDMVIVEMKSKHKNLHVIRLGKNVGLGNALNIGIEYCKCNIIARMDSDDISRTDRCEKQLDVFRSSPSTSICSGIIEEFDDKIENIYAKRCLPERHEDIIEFAKKRNPFNHPCVMYKKEGVLSAGGYQDFYLLEDYYLWIRMLNKQYRGYNLQTPLLYMRGGREMYRRRAGLRYANSQIRLCKFMFQSGFINRCNYIYNVTIRFFGAIAPNWLRTILYQILLRQNKNL